MKKRIISVTLCVGMVCAILVMVALELKLFSLTPEEEKNTQKTCMEIEKSTKCGEATSFFVVYDDGVCWVGHVHGPSCDKSPRTLSVVGIIYQRHRHPDIINLLNLAGAKEVVFYGTPRFKEVAMQVLSPGYFIK